MDTEHITKETIVNYLLGELTAGERDGIEDRLFIDEALADEIDETENDLIDEYVRGELSPAQVKSFERFFLISERRREKLDVARVLNSEIFEEKPVTIAGEPEKASFWESIAAFFRVPVLNLAGMALVLAAVLIGGFLIIRQFKPIDVAIDPNKNVTPTPSPVFTPNGSNQENKNSAPNSVAPNVNTNAGNENNPPKIQPTPENPKPKPTPTVNDDKPITAPQPTFATILLTPMSRSNEAPVLKLPKTTQLARLQVVNDEKEAYEKLRIDVVNSSGNLVFRQNFNGKRIPKSFVINIPADKLNDEDYEITLSGADAGGNFKDLNYYRFSVKKK